MHEEVRASGEADRTVNEQGEQGGGRKKERKKPTAASVEDLSVDRSTRKDVERTKKLGASSPLPERNKPAAALENKKGKRAQRLNWWR